MGIYFGIDPGKSGSVSAIWDDGRPWEGAVCKLDGTGKDVADWFNQFDLADAKAALEQVHSSPQMGVKSAFTFGQSFGHVLGILDANEVPYLLVRPQKWQKDMACMSGGDKNRTKAEAQRRWPMLKVTHRNADSLLLAEWARTHGWRV
jgi:hypothetical protein